MSAVWSSVAISGQGRGAGGAWSNDSANAGKPDQQPSWRARCPPSCRSVGNLDASRFACGIGYLNNHFRDHFVALPKAAFRGGLFCGACVRLWCVDAVCEDALGE